LAIAHTLQTMNLRLAESAPFPVEALLQEFLPAAPAIRTAQAGAALVRSYERLLKNSTAPSYSSAFSGESNMPTFPRLLTASSLREYRRNWRDLSFRNMADPDAKPKPLAARAAFPRRRARLGTLSRRPLSLSVAFASYS
jgi:hypothetical protein